MVKGEAVEQVDKCRYLGLVIDNKLAWHENTDEIIKKDHSRLFCLRKLRSFRVREDILQVFFLSTVSIVLTVSVGEGMLQTRTGTGWKRPSERPGEWLADSRKRLTQSVTDDLPTDSTRICLTTHILWDLSLTLHLLTGVVGWKYPSQKQHASSIHFFRKPYRHPTRHMTDTVWNH